jgi:transcriptional regulator with XRE-family HTH domain
MKHVPVINAEKTGANLKQLRRERYLTVKDIQKELGLANPSGIYRWEKGAAVPAVDNLVILANLYDISIDDILVVDYV